MPRYDREQVSTVGGHAVVVGASIAGLCAARVLADTFERVTVVEKDDLPDSPTDRAGVPQGSQIHALQEAGRATVEDLFPGYGDALLSAGGLLIDASSDVDFYDEGGFFADGPRRAPMYCASRPLLESVLRQRLTRREDVRLRSGCQVTGYRLDDDGTTVEGVSLRNRGGGRDQLAAELTVDATGRTSHTPTWLDEHGYEAPEVEEVHVDLGYSTTTVQRPPDDRRFVFIQASAPHRRGGAAVPIEGGRWQVNLHGMHGDHPPTDREGFEEFAASLQESTVSDILESHTWSDAGIDHYPIPSSRRYHYEKLNRFPDGLVVTGDAIASFNPIYGQGMSVAALEALGLHHALAAGGTERLGTRFFDRLAPVVDAAWTLTVSADLQFPQTTGDRPRRADLLGRYVSRLKRKAHTDGVLADAFRQVAAMEQPPASLFCPRIVYRVLRPGRPRLRSLSGAFSSGRTPE